LHHSSLTSWVSQMAWLLLYLLMKFEFHFELSKEAMTAFESSQDYTYTVCQTLRPFSNRTRSRVSVMLSQYRCYTFRIPAYTCTVTFRGYPLFCHSTDVSFIFSLTQSTDANHSGFLLDPCLFYTVFSLPSLMYSVCRCFFVL
jgi:hypothetical protein